MSVSDTLAPLAVKGEARNTPAFSADTLALLAVK